MSETKIKDVIGREMTKYPEQGEMQISCVLYLAEGKYQGIGFQIIEKSGTPLVGSFRQEAWGFEHDYKEEEVTPLLEDFKGWLTENYHAEWSEKPEPIEEHEMLHPENMEE